MSPTVAVAPSHVDSVRGFNRFYTRRIGVLGDHLLDSPYSLTEMRVLYELAHRPAATATELGRELGLDAGYLSRILRRFEALKLIGRSPATDDARRSVLRLTPGGRKAFAPLDSRARREISDMLGPLPAAARRDVVAAMRDIERLLGGPARRDVPVRLRRHRPGDMGWVVHRHGELYAREWGYTAEFEALVARIVADFLDNLDPAAERCWIAERAGEVVGSVFVVRKTKQVAKLRLLLVEPSARGLGLGKRLVDECVRFARRAGYTKMTLWTQAELTAARHLYQQAGFVCVKQVSQRSFGADRTAETWERDL
jgi:DNA-binding MarR family transcriptional regulator/N-acetylglutamate synthase-like GNAT family acetyltransferase